MYIELRNIYWTDWISILLISCLLIYAICKLFSSLKMEDLLTAYLSNRFIKVTKNNQEGLSLLIGGNLVVYSVCLSLLLYLSYASIKSIPIELKGFVLTYTMVAVFLMSKHYLSKLVANLCDFEEIMYVIDHHRNIYRAMLSFALLLIAFGIVYISGFDVTVIFISLAVVATLLLLYNFIIIYTYRKLLFPVIFYFILYLCALEIAPYLLLYKYIKL